MSLNKATERGARAPRGPVGPVPPLSAIALAKAEPGVPALGVWLFITQGVVRRCDPIPPIPPIHPTEMNKY